jgi:hypothetical protein
VAQQGRRHVDVFRQPIRAWPMWCEDDEDVIRENSHLDVIGTQPYITETN